MELFSLYPMDKTSIARLAFKILSVYYYIYITIPQVTRARLN